MKKATPSFCNLVIVKQYESPEEYRKRLTNYAPKYPLLTPEVIDGLVELLRHKNTQAKADALRRARGEKFAVCYQELDNQIRARLKVLANKRNYIRTAVSLSDPCKTAGFDFITRYRAILNEVRNQLREHKRLGKNPPQTWQELVDAHMSNDLHERHRALPFEIRDRFEIDFGTGVPKPKGAVSPT